MDKPTKADLDAVLDQAAETIRQGGPLEGASAEYADSVAGLLSAQFPGVPELSRITLACAQHISALAVEGVRPETIVHVLGAAALRLEAEAGR